MKNKLLFLIFSNISICMFYAEGTTAYSGIFLLDIIKDKGSSKFILKLALKFGYSNASSLQAVSITSVWKGGGVSVYIRQYLKQLTDSQWKYTEIKQISIHRENSSCLHMLTGINLNLSLLAQLKPKLSPHAQKRYKQLWDNPKLEFILIILGNKTLNGFLRTDP